MANRSKKISSSFLIGIFVMLGTFILVGFLIWMGATQFLKEQVFYVTYFDGSVEGLEPGSAVKYLGVPCGRVQKIQVASDGKLVEVIMNIDDKIALDANYRIKAEMAGLAGGKFLQLFLPTDSTMLAQHPEIGGIVPPYQVVLSAPSGIEEITIAMRDVMNNLMELQVKQISDGTIGFLDATTKFFNDKDLYRLIDDLAAASGRLNSIVAKADTSHIISNISETSFRLNNTANELKNFSENLNKELAAMQLPNVVNKMYAKYDTTMVNTNKSISLITYRIEALLFGLNETFEELRKTNRDMQKSLRVISDNPSQIFLSEPPPLEK